MRSWVWISHKNPGVVACVCSPSFGEVETGRFLELTSQPVELNRWAVSSVRETLSQKDKVASINKYTWRWPPASTCTTHMHLYACVLRPVSVCESTAPISTILFWKSTTRFPFEKLDNRNTRLRVPVANLSGSCLNSSVPSSLLYTRSNRNLIL